MSTCNRLDLQTLGSQPIMPKNLPNHWFEWAPIRTSRRWCISRWDWTKCVQTIYIYRERETGLGSAIQHTWNGPGTNWVWKVREIIFVVDSNGCCIYVHYKHARLGQLILRRWNFMQLYDGGRVRDVVSHARWFSSVPDELPKSHMLVGVWFLNLKWHSMWFVFAN